MGMSFKELQEITPRSLFNKLHGYKSAHRNTWEQVRLQCYYSVAPYFGKEDKHQTPAAFMPFAWDGDKEVDSLEELRQLALAQREKAAKKWKDIDKEK